MNVTSFACECYILFALFRFGNRREAVAAILLLCVALLHIIHYLDMYT